MTIGRVQSLGVVEPRMTFGGSRVAVMSRPAFSHAFTLNALRYNAFMSDTRQTVHVRLKPAAIEAIDKLAEKEMRTRSDMIRVLLAEAVQRRTKGQ